MSLLPKEHGAYGQLAFPLLTAFAVGGVSRAGLAIAVTTLAGFLAHEPATILLGFRGARARREHGADATHWLTACVVAGLVAGATAIALMPAEARWSLGLVLVPATLLAFAWMRGREKSWYSELAAALAFSGVAVPVCLAAEAPLSTAFTAAIPFALLFISGTLAVRVVILRVRSGGDPRAMQKTRRWAFVVTVVAIVLLGTTARADLIPPTILFAAAPGLAVSALVAAFPPAPARLRTLGWALVASSVLTCGIIVAMLT